MKKRALALLFACLMAVGMLAGCDTTIGDMSSVPNVSDPNYRPKIEILTQGWVNTPTNDLDPFKKYLDEKYNIDVTLTAVSDFATQLAVRFASNSPPDIVSFNTATDFNMMYDQDALLYDWTPYLSSMPNFKKVYDYSEEGRLMLTTKDNKLRGVWTLPEDNTWSLKIRKDWLEKLNLDPPKTPEDLLNIARAFTNEDPDGNGIHDTYGFTEGGAGQSFNVLGQWVPYMFGDIWYVKDGQVVNGFTEGHHKKTLDFIKTLVSEQLIDPNWYVQTWAEKTLDAQGKVGIQWMIGSIAVSSESYVANDGSTVGWWETYEVPKDPDGGPWAGYMPANAVASHIISVSSKAALDSAKMQKIVKLIDDVIATPDGVRPETYDALRWGVGVEEGHAMIPVEGTSYVYTNTGETDTVKLYWNTVPGGWDWGSWFNIPNTDGVVHGTQAEPTDVIRRVIEMNEKAIGMERVPSMNMLTLNASVENQLRKMQNTFEYQYVTGRNTDYDGFVRQWREQGGDQLLAQATQQLKEMGFIPAN